MWDNDLKNERGGSTWRWGRGGSGKFFLFFRDQNRIKIIIKKEKRN